MDAYLALHNAPLFMRGSDVVTSVVRETTGLFGAQLVVGTWKGCSSRGPAGTPARTESSVSASSEQLEREPTESPYRILALCICWPGACAPSSAVVGYQGRTELNSSGGARVTSYLRQPLRHLPTLDELALLLRESLWTPRTSAWSTLPLHLGPRRSTAA